MKKFTFIASFVMMLFGFGTFAFGAEICSEGTQQIVDQATGQIYCVSTDAMPVQQQNLVSDAAAREREQQFQQTMMRRAEIEGSMKSSGFVIDMGLGYSIAGAFELRIAAGYDFLESLDGLSFGLLTDFGISFGYPDSLNWSVGPIAHVNSKTYRVGLGLGLGVFSIWGNLYSGDDEYYDDSDEFGLKRGGAYFMLKPQFMWEWFVSSHTLIGLGFDLPIIFKGVDDTAHDNLMIWYDLHVSVGYKF
ncbi:MAG: hypothetical protein IJM59_07665 [Proteobacteria bacterium]|nr:hypothetical protein [Pseudomonadota bacterium]